MDSVLQKAAFERFLPDPDNPRCDITDESVSDLAASIKAHDIKVPVLAYAVQNDLMTVDGHRRLKAARLAGLKEVPVMVFPQKPSAVDILMTQLTINGHRESLNPVDEYEAFTRLATLNRWTHSDLASGLAVSHAEVTRVMAIGKLSLEERQLVRSGKISKSAAYALSRMSPEQRAAMLRKAASGEVTRDQLNNHARRKAKGSEIKSRRVNCQIAGGTVSVQTETGLNVVELIEVFEELVRELRKARNQNWDITTAVRVLRDRARAHPTA